MPDRHLLLLSLSLLGVTGAGWCAVIAAWLLLPPAVIAATAAVGGIATALIGGLVCWGDNQGEIPLCNRCQQWHRGRCR